MPLVAAVGTAVNTDAMLTDLLAAGWQITVTSDDAGVTVQAARTAKVTAPTTAQAVAAAHAEVLGQ